MALFRPEPRDRGAVYRRNEVLSANIIGVQIEANRQAAPKILPPHKAAKAGHYNRKHARRIGWSSHWPGVCHVLKIANGNILPEDFGQYVARFQADQRLKTDGMLGTDTWRRMLPLAKAGPGSMAQPPWLPKALPRTSPVRAVSPAISNGPTPWMDVALAQQTAHWIGEDGKAVKGSASQVDDGYFEACPYMGEKVWELDNHAHRKTEGRAWCAAFVNYCLHTTGYSHTGSTGAFSFRRRDLWRFKALQEPVRGCVIVLKSNSKNWHHVAFLDEPGDLPSGQTTHLNTRGLKGIKLLGGNQGGRTVCSTVFTNCTFYAAKDKDKKKSPYLFPVRGEDNPNCNVELPTAAPHFCGSQWL